MTPPPNFDEALKRGLIADEKKGILTFSNGTQGYGWMESNCFACRFYDPEAAGELCALECAMLLGRVSPELATLFGFTRDDAAAAEFRLKYPKEDCSDDWKQWWSFGDHDCGMFREKFDDDGNEIPAPPPVDPRQLVLFADPTEDAAMFNAPAPVEVEAMQDA